MKFALIFIFFFISVFNGFSQESQITQDPKAEQILEKVALKTKAMISMQADFEMIIEDRKENIKNSLTGKLIMKQNKYKLTNEGSVVFFDGITMWTYSISSNEVTITKPEENSTDFLSKPSTFFSTYKNDFKYKYVNETSKNGLSWHEIDLFPKNLNQPYSRIKAFINIKSFLPEIISSIGKDGVDYTVILKNIITDKDIPDATFTFDPSKYKKVEIIDMR